MLIRAGKGHWVRPREDDVVAKGKGVLKTFWLTPSSKRAESLTASENGTYDEIPCEYIPVNKNVNGIMKHERLVGWMVEILKESIKAIAAQHAVVQKRTVTIPAYHGKTGEIPLDELVEAVKLPDFDGAVVAADASSVVVKDEVVESLREFVSIVSINELFPCIQRTERQCAGPISNSDISHISLFHFFHRHCHPRPTTTDCIDIPRQLFS